MRQHDLKAALAARESILFACENTVRIQAAEGEGETRKPATFDVLAYTGVPMEVDGYDLPVAIELSSARFAKSIRSNLDHKTNQRVGHVTKHENDGRQLTFAGVASAATSYRDEVVNSAADGYEWEASIEGKPGKIETLGRGETAEVNGRTVKGPMYIAKGTLIRAFGFVSHGADGGTTVKIAATTANGATKMTDELRAWIVEMGTDPDTLSEKQIKAWQETYAGKNGNGQKSEKGAAEVKGEKPKTAAEMFEAERQEIRRKEAITKLAQETIHAQQWRGVEYVDAVQKLAEEAIEAGTSEKEFKLELLTQTNVPAGIVAQANGRRRQPTTDLLQAALCIAGGLKDVEKHFPGQQGEQLLNQAADRWPKNIRLGEFFQIIAKGNGYTDISANDVPAMFRAVFGPPQIAAAGFSTVNIPNLLSNVQNKFLAEGYMYVENAWERVSPVVPAVNFKQFTTNRLTGNEKFEKVPPGGEIPHAVVGDQVYTNQVYTYARMISLPFQDIVNDDLNALSAVPRRLGRGGALKFNEDHWTEWLADQATRFTTARGNYFEGAATNLQASSLNTAGTLAMKQTDPNGNPIGIMFPILLVPPDLKYSARGLYISANFNSGGAATTEQIPDANVYQNEFEPVVSQYLSSTAITGNSATAWFLVPNPNPDFSYLQVAFLNNQRMPQVESAEADFNRLGVQSRAVLHYGIAHHEYRAAVKSKGAA